MITLLLTLAVSVPVACTLASGATRRGFRLDHVAVFSFGFLFYWVSPILVGILRPLPDRPELGIWYDLFDSAFVRGRLAAYLGCILLFYLSFVIGAAAGRRVGREPRAVDVLRFNPSVLNLLLPPVLGLIGVYAWRVRDQLFTGYVSLVEADVLPRGSLIASSLVLLSLFLLHRAYSDARDTGAARFRALMTDHFFLAYLIVGVLVLSLGSRLYFVSSILMVVTYATVYGRPIPYLTAALLMAGIAMAAAVGGAVRLGGDVTWMGMAVNIASEPLFTSFSLLSFVRDGSLPALAWPKFLLGDLINLIPSVLLPSKTTLMLRPEDFGHTVYAPFGALSSFFSFLINFGIVGTAAVLFTFGASLSVLGRQRAALQRVIYAMLCGWLAFTFYRDAFSISLVKSMFQFSVLVPVIIAMVAHVLTVVGRPARTRLTEPASPSPSARSAIATSWPGPHRHPR